MPEIHAYFENMTEAGRVISTRLCVNVEEEAIEDASNIIKKNGGRIFTTFIE
jgi:hypothetical protein